MNLTTERLWIRKFKPTDWKATHSYTSDREGSLRLFLRTELWRRLGFFKKCTPIEDGWWDEFYYATLKEEYVADQKESQKLFWLSFKFFS
nr:hypothetical protein [Halobacillus mangrovi]